MANFSRNIKVVTDLPSFAGGIGLSDIGTKGSPPMFGSTTRKVSLVDWIQYAYDQGWLNFSAIPPGSVDFSEIQNISTNKLLGRYSAGSGSIQEITIGTGLTLSGGGTLSAAGGGGGLTVGTSSISSGTSGRVLYDNAGILGEMTTTGSGTELVLSNSPTIVTPTIAKLANLTSNGFVKTSSGDGTLSIDTTTYVSAAAGSDTYVQFNDGGAFGGNSGLTFSKTLATLKLTTGNVTGITTSAGFNLAANSLTSGDAISMSSSSLTSGRMMFIGMTGTTGLTGKTGIQLLSTGANGTTGQTTTGISSLVSNTGSGTNIAGSFSAAGGTTNYGIQIALGQLIVTGGNASIPAIATASYNTTGLYFDGTGTSFTSAGTNYITLKPLASTWNTTVSTGTGTTAGLQFTANSLTTGNGIDASTSSLTTGMLAQFASTSTALSGTNSCVQKIMSSGANTNSGVTATGQQISVTNTGTTSTNSGLFIDVNGATNNYGIQVMAGATRGIFRTSLTSNADGLIVGDWTGTGNGALLRFIRPSGASIGTTFNQGNQDFVITNAFGGIIFTPTLTTNDGFTVTTSTLTTGSLATFTSTSTALSGTPSLFKIISSGANANSGVVTTGLNVSVTNSGTTSTNVGLGIAASGATLNTALSVTSGRTVLSPTVVATANYGTLSVGAGAFDGSTAGFFAGSSNGTNIAVNSGSASSADLINLQKGGTLMFRVTSGGLAQSSGGFFPTATVAGISGIWISNTDGTTDTASPAGFQIYQGSPNNVTKGVLSVATVNMTSTSGTNYLFRAKTTLAAGAGSANWNIIGGEYTINNSGAQSGTATGIFLNATETALNSMTHNLMDLQVGGTSKFKVTAGMAVASFTVNGLTVANTVTATDYTISSASNYINWSARSKIYSPADGNIRLTNNAGTGFGLLILGDATSSFPAIQRNSAAISFRLADDSGYANVRGKQFRFESATCLADTADGVLTLSNNAQNDFGRLQFGGTTSSFPAEKRNGATIETRLADDSGYAAVQSLYIRFGSGSPEGVVSAPVGAIYSRTDGGANTTLYVKESGVATAGWVAK